MERRLLSVDWDYFVKEDDINYGSYAESRKNLVDTWYKRYIKEKAQGRDIEKLYHLLPENRMFWEKIEQYFAFTGDVEVYVSDSHALSYEIAKKTGCDTVYLFDSHTDLGYGGPQSLDFELNCSNWLGMLLRDRVAKAAYIFLSMHTHERPEMFDWANRAFNIKYCDLAEFVQKITVSAVHICRSGAWTPPWFDSEFEDFVAALAIAYNTIDCPKRDWEPENLNFSQEILYLLA